MKIAPCRRIVSSASKFLAISTLSLSVGHQEAVAYTVKTTFPRLGGYKIGSPQAYDDPAYQAKLAKLDVAVIEFYRNWGTTQQIRSAAQGIKAKNPNIILLDYVIQETIHQTYSTLQTLRDKLTANKWWLYVNGTNGSLLVDPYNAATTNYTNFVPKDANGDRWNTWFAKDVYNTMWSQVPELDGTYTDNFWWKPRVNGDWNRDGTTDSRNDLTVRTWYRGGMMTHVNKIKALMPGKLVTGNIGDWQHATTTLPEYDGQLNGGVLEHYIGAPWSPEGVDMDGNKNSWGSWQTMMKGYRKLMSMTKDPKLVIFNMKEHLNDYRTFRYGFASALMDNGYFDFSSGDGGLYSTVPWFDEYDVAGTRTTSWLGTAIDPPQLLAWQNGVYRRRFQNGMVIVNPRGNGDRTVTVPAGYKRFSGRQDPVVNNGQVATTITMRDRDGIFLIKN
jgi:hypothetical protein